MPDNQNITQNLLDMYGRDDWIMRMNFGFFIRLSGLAAQPRGARILDCGCGMGHLIRALGQSGFSNLTGLDAAPEMVEAARALTGKPIILADVARMSSLVPAHSFEVVIISDLLHHLETQEQYQATLAGCAQALTPGGLLIIREPFPLPLIRLLRALAGMEFLQKGPLKARLRSFIEEAALLDFFNAYWVPDYPARLGEHGFVIIKERDWLVHRITTCRGKAGPA